jgi:ribosome-binding protein aMBF1 (putative translation factor)
MQKGLAMTHSTEGAKIRLTLELKADVARRLAMAAEARKCSAADLAAELLDRYLPRQAEAKKGSIPYA